MGGKDHCQQRILVISSQQGALLPHGITIWHPDTPCRASIMTVIRSFPDPVRDWSVLFFLCNFPYRIMPGKLHICHPNESTVK